MATAAARAAPDRKMQNRYLIAGLGNPGPDYAETRHNAGFMVVEKMASRAGARWSEKRRFKARLARFDRGQAQVLLCEPLTFMNASGESVGAVRAFYQVPLDRLVVVVDDADLPLGVNRLRPGGGSGGHHGLESIEHHVGSSAYARLRVGIGRAMAGQREITSHVLSRFAPSEMAILSEVLDRVVQQIECWLDFGLQKAMNEFNGAIKSAPAREVAE